jgi:exonuclease SbcC
MIIKTLTLKNFRKFKNASIEFPDGVTCVVGLNGVGKSTIFESIAWVLYGSVAARTSVDQIKREGADSSDSCRVELDFIFEDNSYRIVREMSGKSLTIAATVTVNGKIAATGAEIVSKYIQKVLGIDFKSFFTSIFAKQKELNTLSSMVASDRRPLILRMLGIDSLDEVIKDIKSDKKDKDSLIEKINQNLIDETGKDKIQVYENEIKDLKEQKNVSENLIKASKEKIHILKKSVNEIGKKCNAYKNDYERIKLKKEQLLESKTLFEHKEKLTNEIKILKNKINERQIAIDQQKKKLINFSNLDKDIKYSEERLFESNKKIEELLKNIEGNKTLVKRFENDIKEIKTKKEKIQEIGPDAKCPTCERVLDKQYKTLLTKFDDEIIRKEKNVKSFLKNIKGFEEKRERCSREEQALKKKKEYLQNKLREKDRIETTINNYIIEITKEKIDRENKEKMVEKLSAIKFDPKEFETTSKQVNELFKMYQNILEERDSKKDDLSNLKIDVEKKESDKKLISQKIENFKEKLSEFEKSKKQIKEEKIVVQRLGMLIDVMSNFRTHLISRIRPTLSSYSSDYFGRLTDGKYNEVELDENYNLLVYDNGTAYGIERFSGGEEDLANLCLRLAISEVITERAGGLFNFIVLDEIFGSQDMYRRQNIMKALKSLSSKFRQIFLITHIDEIKNYMENAITILEEENGESKIKIE